MMTTITRSFWEILIRYFFGKYQEIKIHMFILYFYLFFNKICFCNKVVLAMTNL